MKRLDTVLRERFDPEGGYSVALRNGLTFDTTMSEFPRVIETRIATMSLVAPGFIEQRFRLGARIDLAGFAENKEARFKLADGVTCVMLSVIPKDMDFDVSVTTVDHFAPERGMDTLQALAVVVQDNMSEMVTKLFFSYFPTVFRTRVFDGEHEARMWLEKQIVEIASEQA